MLLAMPLVSIILGIICMILMHVFPAIWLALAFINLTCDLCLIVQVLQWAKDEERKD